MTLPTRLDVAALVAGVLVAIAAPAQAVITTFASYTPIGSGSNVRWSNNGSNGANNGTGGSVYTIASSGATAPGSRLVKFSFLQPVISSFVNDVNATFTLNATAPSGNPAQLAAGFLIQSGISGSFSFISTAPITIFNTTFATGSNLLSGSFGSAEISGRRNGTSGGFGASVAGGASITYTSDFLDFTSTVDRDFALSLTSITSPLQATPSNTFPNRALRVFRATSVGSFSSDPAPLVTAIPEPAIWATMIVGFGMVGLRTRRRSRCIIAA